MPYLSINRDRFHYLLATGTQEGELKRFFAETQKQLVIRGARIQNKPANQTARVKALVERLPPSTDDIVRGWFSKNISMIQPEPQSELIEEFQLYETLNDQVPKDRSLHLSRSCLVHLFQDEPDPALLAFLRSPVGVSPVLVSEPAPQPEVDSSAENMKAGDAYHSIQGAIASAFAAFFDGTPVDEFLEDLPPALVSVIQGLNELRRGDFDAAEKEASTISEGTVERASLTRSIARAKRKLGESTIAGVTTEQVEPHNGDFDADRDPVLAFCTGDKPLANFVHPVGRVRSGRLYTFSDEQRRLFFPLSGDVMAFLGADQPRQPKRGEICIWKVAEHKTDKPTHFHITKELDPVYELNQVPFHSSEADSVRAYIQQLYLSRTIELLQKQLFELSDGVVVAPKRDRDLSNDDAFESPFHRWERMFAIPFEGRLIVLGPLPEPAGAYDCAPISTSVRQLAKAMRGAAGNPITKAQLKELIATVQNDDVGIDRQRLSRIIGRIDLAFLNEEALTEARDVLMNDPSIAAKLEQRIREKAQEHSAHKESVKKELASLEAQKVQLEGKIKSLSESERKKVADIGKTVRHAFDEAIANGVESLAKSAIVRELGGGVQNRTSEARDVQEDVRPVHMPQLTRDEAVKELKKLGLDQRTSFHLIETIQLLSSCGIVALLDGGLARVQAKLLAVSLGATVSAVEVPVGLIRPSKSILSWVTSEQASTLLVLAANRSDMDLYAPDWTEELHSRMPNKARAIGIICALARGPMTLPVPESVARLSVRLDLDRKYDFDTTGRTDIESLRAAVFPDGAKLIKPMLEDLLTRLGELEEPALSGVSVILSASFQQGASRE